MWFLLFIVAVIVIAIAGAVYQSKLRDEHTTTLMTGRSDAEVFVGADHSYICLDFDKGTIALGREHLVDGGADERPFRDIMTVEVIEDGRMLSQTNRGSQLVGAAVGGLALGWVGAIIGGVTGSTRGKRNVGSIILRIHLASRKLPTQDVLFFKSPSKKGSDRNGILAKGDIAKANRFHSLVLQAMRLAAEGAPAPTIAPEPTMAAFSEPRVEPQLAISVPEQISNERRRFERAVGR